MSHHCTARIERHHMTYELDVEFVCNKGHRGYRNRLGVPEEPDTDPEVDIVSVLYDGDTFDTSYEEDQSIIEQCWDSLD